MLTTIAVDVRIHTLAAPVETYRLFHWADRAAWKANASAYPSSVIGAHCIEMDEDEKRAFDVVVAFARVRMKRDYVPLRTSV